VYSDVGAQQNGLVMAKKVKKAPFDVKAFLATVDGGRTLSSYRNEEAIFSQVDPADAVFYIQKGQVTFPSKGRKPLLRSRVPTTSSARDA
jgi:hypothetical protein